HHVVEDAPGIARRERADIADVAALCRERIAKVDATVRAEALDRLTGLGVQRREKPGIEINEPAVGAVLALPIVDASRADRAFVRMGPALLAGCGIERDDVAVT